MSHNPTEDFKKTSQKITGKLHELAKSTGDQKKMNKLIKEIKNIRNELDKNFEKMGPFMDKMHIDKQEYQNASNGVKRALNQPSESNIQNAVSKISEINNKLAA
jgi:hypothetical protein